MNDKQAKLHTRICDALEYLSKARDIPEGWPYGRYLDACRRIVSAVETLEDDIYNNIDEDGELWFPIEGIIGDHLLTSKETVYDIVSKA